MLTPYTSMLITPASLHFLVFLSCLLRKDHQLHKENYNINLMYKLIEGSTTNIAILFWTLDSQHSVHDVPDDMTIV